MEPFEYAFFLGTAKTEAFENGFIQSQFQKELELRIWEWTNME